MKYFAIIKGEQKGPFDLQDLVGAGVRPSTYVWCKGMGDWQKAEDVADICRMFRIRIHDLMHPESVEAEKRDCMPTAQRAKPENIGNPPAQPTRFDRYLSGQGQHLPTLEEIDAMENKDLPPAHTMTLAVLATIFFPPTGFAAIYFSHKSSKLWNEAETLAAENDKSKTGKINRDNKEALLALREEAHYNCRSAKMWTGITICLGFILYAFLCR